MEMTNRARIKISRARGIDRTAVRLMESKLSTVPEPCTGSRRGAARLRGRGYDRTSKVTKFRKKPTMDVVDGSLVWFAIVRQR
jgi:hypothetical protein